MLAQKVMRFEAYVDWSNVHRQATLKVKNKEEELEKVALIIEKDFDIVGSTAIEDRLQEGVP